MPEKNFLETFPLYKKHHVGLYQTFAQVPKPPITFECPKCGSVQTYVMVNEYNSETRQTANSICLHAVLRATYCCVGCESHERIFLIKMHSKTQEIEKVGQYPAWDITGDRGIEKLLGDHKSYMRRGMICESQGYGIAAFAYYRRITEEIIDGLIQDIAALIPPDEQATYNEVFEEVKKTRQTAEKIALVKDLLPSSLTVEGMNPLGVLHRALSEGLHAESDQDCLEYAEAVREALAFLVGQVSANKAQKKNFSDKMRKLLDKKTKAGEQVGQSPQPTG